MRRSGSALMAALGLATAGMGVPGMVDLDGPVSLASVAEVVIVDSASPQGGAMLTATDVGVVYSIEASGTYTWDPEFGTADAECSTWNPDATYRRTRSPYAEPNWDLVVNGVNVEWTPATEDANGCDTTSHTYRAELAGNGQPWTFVVDRAGGRQDDNVGYLTVKVVDTGVETAVGDAQGRIDEVRGEGEDALNGVRDAIADLTPSTLPELPTTTTVPDTTLPTVPDTTLPTVPDTTTTTVPDTTLPTVPDTTLPTVPDGEIGPGLVTGAVAEVLDEAEARRRAAEEQAETTKQGAEGQAERQGEAAQDQVEATQQGAEAAQEQVEDDPQQVVGEVGSNRLPVDVPPQPVPETSSTTTPTTTPTTIPGPGPQSGPTPNPGSPPVGGTSVLDPGEDGGPGPQSEITTQSPDAIVAGKTLSRNDGGSKGSASASGDGLGEVVALDLPPADRGGRKPASVPEKILRAPIDAARESPIGAIVVALLLLGATSVLSLRAFRRARFERLSRAYRYR